ncbi:multiple organellar RNA editing factor 8, chloroplastic/mitochondrial-like [Telopea speciosissima]|uniref:multiple organellar RNA editing factor 8, chloroplastic/mitochondrial-like n=1 Tax=Telopea speciosissima TaxID=54955 RepID=UPI001CC42D0E|nr:multiple organellar RNA editing factor 8, chloroplastic/mitochondrial-like [Telopea speciosissima]
MMSRRALISLKQQAEASARKTKTIIPRSSISTHSSTSLNFSLFTSSSLPQNQRGFSLRNLFSSSSPWVSVASNIIANAVLVVRGLATRSMDSSANRPPKETILLEGCDFEHWLVVMEPPDPNHTRDDIIDSYIKTLAQVIGSEEEARHKIYSVSTKHYFAFGALVSEDLSYKIKELPKVRWVLPDSYLNVRNKSYGGEPFIDGQAVPYDPKYHEEWVRNNARANERSRRNDRPRNNDRSRNFERRRGDMPPPSPSPPASRPDFQTQGDPNRDMSPPVQNVGFQNNYTPPPLQSRDFQGRDMNMPPPAQKWNAQTNVPPPSPSPPASRPDFQTQGDPNRDMSPPVQKVGFQNNYTPPPLQSCDFQGRDMNMPPPPQKWNAQTNVPPPAQNWNSQTGMQPPAQNWNSQNRGMPPPPQNLNAQSNMAPPPQNLNAQSNMPPLLHNWNAHSNTPPQQNWNAQTNMPPPPQNWNSQRRDTGVASPTHNWNSQDRDVNMGPPTQSWNSQGQDMNVLPATQNWNPQSRDILTTKQNQDFQNREMQATTQNWDAQTTSIGNAPTGNAPNVNYQSRYPSTGGNFPNRDQMRDTPTNMVMGNVQNRDYQSRDMPGNSGINMENRVHQEWDRPSNMNMGNTPSRDHQTRDMPAENYEYVANRSF